MRISIGVVFQLSLAMCAGRLHAGSDRDTFGIAMFHPTKSGSRIWTSAHWANGQARSVKYAEDPSDPTGWTEDHSGGTDGFRIDGAGTMTMSGSGPRFHVNSMDSSKVRAQFFRNTEFTAYYQRHGANGANYGGMVVGARSGPLGHASGGGNDCDATTYYARFRNDGKWDIEKELKHPGSTYWSGAGLNTQDPLWGGTKLPQGRWIGMKYIVYDLDSSRSRVRMELYIDSVTGGDATKGDHWMRVGAVVDSGQWASGDVLGCTYPATTVISPGHGTFLWRTDGDTALYRMVSIREIDPTVDLVTSAARPSIHAAHAEWWVVRQGRKLSVRRGDLEISAERLSWTGPDGRNLAAPPEEGLAFVTLSGSSDHEAALVWIPAAR